MLPTILRDLIVGRLRALVIWRDGDMIRRHQRLDRSVVILLESLVERIRGCIDRLDGLGLAGQSRG